MVEGGVDVGGEHIDLLEVSLVDLHVLEHPKKKSEKFLTCHCERPD